MNLLTKIKMMWAILHGSQEERELHDLMRQYRRVEAEVKSRELRNDLQFMLSKHRVLKQIEHVEYQKPADVKPSTRSMMLRFPCFQGSQFQFNSAGYPTEYPFYEQENWREVRFEDEDYPFFRHSDDLGWLMGWSPVSLGLGGQFPREMMPGSMSSIRVMTGLDLLRFQSKIMFETIAPYSGVINHLINYTCGDKGAAIVASSKDKKLGKEVSDYLSRWCDSIGFLNKVRDCCNHLLVQGECFPRRWRDSRVTLTDPSWCRGPHNEIGQSPWSYGILSPNWPYETDTVGAFHIWYPSNDHETLSPMEQFHARLDSSAGPSAKRSVPLNYRIRPLLPLLETIAAEMGQGEARRQKISYIVSLPAAADKQSVLKRGLDSPFGKGLMDYAKDLGPDMAGMYNAESGAWQMPNVVQVTAPPVGTAASESACKAYDKLATVAANAVGVASWMFGSDFKEASRATSLTAAEPSVKTGKNIQRILCEVWKDIAQAECLLNLETDFPEDMFKSGLVKIHVELPNVEVRDMNDLYDRLSKQMKDRLKSPQNVASEMGDSFEDEQDLYKIAEESGWKAPLDRETIHDEDTDLKGTTSSGLPTGSQELRNARQESLFHSNGRR